MKEGVTYLKFHQLEYFIAVAEELHFGKAADKLNISQPPLSQQIKKLEDNLNIKLFNRTKRRVELTNSGQLFLQDAYKILEQVEMATDKLKQSSNGEIGELVLGYSSYSIFDILPMILKEFYKLYPNINLKLKHMSTSEQEAAFQNSEIHVGLLCPPINQKELHLDVIYSQPFVVALPSDHPLVNRGEKHSLNIRELSNYPFIMTPRSIGRGYYDRIINICFDGNFSPQVVQEVNELHELISLVSTGLGISIVPKSLTQFNKDNVTYMMLNNDNYLVETALVCKSNETSKIVFNFLEIAKKILRDT